MENFIVRSAVRSLFIVTSRGRAIDQAKRALEDYLRLAEGMGSGAGRRPVEVPPMRGIDEDMRKWSFYMILEHNAIVDRSISATIRQLVRDEPLSGAAAIDPKKDVMPSPAAGEEQLQAFIDSVQAHIEMVRGLGKLRGTKTALHPVFGEFDAHKWHCMFSFHLRLHYRQAKYVAGIAKSL